MGKTSKIKKLEGVLKDLVRELENLTSQPDPISHHIPVSIDQTNRITAGFNVIGFSDLPRRQGLLRRIAACRRRIAALQVSPYAESFALAA